MPSYRTYIATCTANRVGALRPKEKQERNVEGISPRNSVRADFRLCFLECHSFHSFERTTLKKLFFFSFSLSLPLTLFSFFFLFSSFRLPLKLFPSPVLSLSLSLSLSPLRLIARLDTWAERDRGGNNRVQTRIVLAARESRIGGGEGGEPCFSAIFPNNFAGARDRARYLTPSRRGEKNEKYTRHDA